jgi:hypothetical protein
LEEITSDRSYKSRFDDFGGRRKVGINPNWVSFYIKEKYYPKPDKGRQIFACVEIQGC